MDKPFKDTCPKCGEKVIEKNIEFVSYRSGSLGAKHSDICTIYLCPNCGEVEPIVSPKRIEEYNNWKAWIDSLPSSFDIPWDNGKGVDHIVRVGSILTDRWGNYLAKVPDTIGTDIVEFMKNLPVPE